MGNHSFHIAMLCGPGLSSRIMYHALASDVNVTCVILEEKPPARQMIKRRFKKLGVLKVCGQLLFIAFNDIYSKLSHERIKKLIINYNLNCELIPKSVLIHVKSVNSKETIQLLKDLDPDAVVVIGTRIISKTVLSSINAPFINMHTGITPRYRGVQGGYWALARQDPEHCGVTIHLIDQGIDTGGVLYQDTIHPGDGDNFNTYSIHQIAKAIPLMKAALNDVQEHSITIKPGLLPSRLWYHPTLFEYFMHWIRQGVK